MSNLNLQETLAANVELASWTHPSTGAVRYYVNSSNYEARLLTPFLLAGVFVSFSGSGWNHDSKKWTGSEWEKISNNSARTLALGKVFWEAGVWHGVENSEVIAFLNTLLPSSKEGQEDVAI